MRSLLALLNFAAKRDVTAGCIIVCYCYATQKPVECDSNESLLITLKTTSVLEKLSDFHLHFLNQQVK